MAVPEMVVFEAEAVLRIPEVRFEALDDLAVAEATKRTMPNIRKSSRVAMVEDCLNWIGKRETNLVRRQSAMRTAREQMTK